MTLDFGRATIKARVHTTGPLLNSQLFKSFSPTDEANPWVRRVP